MKSIHVHIVWFYRLDKAEKTDKKQKTEPYLCVLSDIHVYSSFPR